MTTPIEEYEIPLRVADLQQLFHSLDPSPFRERDFDAEAEKLMVSWAQEAPRDAAIVITLHLPRTETHADAEAVLADAVRNNFEYRTQQATRDLRELFREGQWALLIGLPVLALSLIGSQTIETYAPHSTLGGLVAESLIILGWVANWRPLEIFLYGWWPILRRRSLYRRLAAARVVVRWETARSRSP